MNMKFTNLLHAEKLEFEYRKKTHSYILKIEGTNIFAGQIYFMKTKRIWLFEPHSMIVFYPESMDQIYSKFKELNNGENY